MSTFNEADAIRWFEERGYYLPDNHPSPFTVFEPGDHFLVDINEDSYDIDGHSMLENNGKWFTVKDVARGYIGYHGSSSVLIEGCYYAWYHMGDYVKKNEEIESPGIPF